MNTSDIIVIILLCAAVAAAVIVMVRNRKNGRSGCGGDCTKCGGCGSNDRRKK